jgi:5-formyltetrahydrofolate cyclo-ligase
VTRLAQAEASAKVVAFIREMPSYQRASIVGMYYPIGKEIDLTALLDDGKRFCFPKITDKDKAIMELHLYDGTFVTGSFSTLEPTGEIVSKSHIDLILVPGVAFDTLGNRLGYGKGFYDNYLRDYRGVTAGIAYDFQIVDVVPSGTNDIGIQSIVTDKEILCIQP